MKAIHLPADRAFLRYIEVPGDDPPLLWLHGWQCSSTGELMPAAVQPPLRGRRSLLIDFLGHGYSDKPRDFPYTLEAHARTIVALIDVLGLTECGIVGHSMGGDIGIQVAAARPEVVSLLILAESGIDASGEGAAFPEDEFGKLIEEQEAEAEAEPGGLRAVHRRDHAPDRASCGASRVRVHAGRDGSNGALAARQPSDAPLVPPGTAERA